MFTILSTCKGGGYMYCRTNPPHPKQNAKGLYPLHRVVLENKLGRLLAPGEEAHHADEDKSNNAPSNIELKSKSDHAKHHNPVLENFELTCPKCDKKFCIKQHLYRQRVGRNKSKKIFCSRSCGGCV